MTDQFVPPNTGQRVPDAYRVIATGGREPGPVRGRCDGRDVLVAGDQLPAQRALDQVPEQDAKVVGRRRSEPTTGTCRDEAFLGPAAEGPFWIDQGVPDLASADVQDLDRSVVPRPGEPRGVGRCNEIRATYPALDPMSALARVRVPDPHLSVLLGGREPGTVRSGGECPHRM